jgi:hypothetical protein
MAGFERILGEVLGGILGDVLHGVVRLFLIAVAVVIAFLYVIYLVLTGDWAQVASVLRALAEWLRSAGAL